MLKTFLSEILDNFFWSGWFGLFIIRLDKCAVLPDFELDRGLEFHGVILIVKNPTLDFIGIIIIFENGNSINFKLLFFITWRHLKWFLVNTFHDLLLGEGQSFL